MKKQILRFLCAFCAIALLLSVCSFLRFADRCDDITNRVLRLHVLADSDTDEAQSLKLTVRDRLLAETSARLNPETASYSDAREELAALLPELTAAAEEELATHGCSLPVKLELAETYFTTRTYGDYTLPAGKYEALRAIIGSGKGQNWWCIVFPPLCLTPSLGEFTPQTELDAVLTEEEMEIVSNYPQYEFRFKVVEWIQNLAQKWFSR